MQPLILLDFDGVLFNSAVEAYDVCERVASSDKDRFRSNVSLEEFMDFRAKLTDAWQFNRLYQKTKILRDLSKLSGLVPDSDDWQFCERFFNARAQMMQSDSWAESMSPYPFFFQLRDRLNKYPHLFKILSTRNKDSIACTLEYFKVAGVAIYGQEDVRTHGSKLDVALNEQLLDSNYFILYLDDMRSHLGPFKAHVSFCMHAGWGYDPPDAESFTQGQASTVIEAILQLTQSA